MGVCYLKESEVSDVKYIPLEEYRSLLAKEDLKYVPYDVNGQYGQLFEILSKRYGVKCLNFLSLALITNELLPFLLFLSFPELFVNCFNSFPKSKFEDP